MSGRPVVRRHYAQARRMRRFETERPSAGAIVREGVAWAGLNRQRLPGLVLALGCFVLLVLLFSEPRFFVYGLRVSGNRIVSPDQLYAASDVDTCSIFFVAPKAVQQRLLECFPGLQDVRVALGLPARLQVRVVEKQAQYVWEAGGRTRLADDRGNIMGSGTRPADAIVISCVGPEAPTVGQRLDPAILDTAARLSGLLGGARSFLYTVRFGVGWRTEQGWLAYFGTGGDLPQKVAVMRSMVADLTAKGIQPEYLDVGVPSRPYYR